MTRIKHDLILRIIKIMDAVLMTVPLRCAGICTMQNTLHRHFMQMAIIW